MKFRIKEARELCGMSQKDLAKRLDISAATLSGYETGAHDPKSDMLSLIADICHVTTDYLLDRKTDVRSLAAKPIFETQIFARRTPRLNEAAMAAAKVLIDYHVAAAPVNPIQILKSMPDVFVVTFTEMADGQRIAQDSSPSLFGSNSQDAVSYSLGGNGSLRVVAYNQRMPYYIVQMAVARELGHIVLGHDSARHDEADVTEALYFARHLLCPRPLVRALMDKQIPLSVEALGNLTGCYGRTLAGMRSMPGAVVPASMNRRVRAQFALYVDTIIDHYAAIEPGDDFVPAEFGSYLDNYEE